MGHHPDSIAVHDYPGRELRLERVLAGPGASQRVLAAAAAEADRGSDDTTGCSTSGTHGSTGGAFLMLAAALAFLRPGAGASYF